MKKQITANELARLSLMTALEVSILYISALLPSARMAAVAIAGLVSIAAVTAYGHARALLVFVASALLSAFIVPDKGNVLLFAAFFGYYPIVKSLLEKPDTALFRWVLKIVMFNTVFCGLWLLARGFLLADMPEYMALLYIALPICNAAFIVYDIGLSKLIAGYISRFWR